MSEIKEKGIYFSQFYNIVESKDWANLVVEEGSGSSYNKGILRSEETKIKISNSKRGKSWYHNPNTLEEMLTNSPKENFIKGRSPKTKHGGRIGEYGKGTERSLKISNSKKGISSWNNNIPHTKECKLKISQSSKKTYEVGRIANCAKEIKINGKLFNSLRQAHKELNISLYLLRKMIKI